MTQSFSPPQDDAVVRVAVRARPLLEKEILDNCQECVSYCADRREISLGKEKRFTFDHVFSPDSGQQEVYLACVKPLVDSCIAGYNATVLAYGQTGSGKTHTMGSANSNGLHEHELGILPRVIRQLYRSIEEQKQAEFLVKCSFVEIYNEEIKDLLHPDTPSKSIFIREDANGDIILAGVREEVVTNFDDMMKFLEQGSTFRTTGSTLMNQHSSRSHAIFTIIVQQRTITDCTSDIDIITAKFHLVDLAGSERAKRTGAVGVRFKESITINSGLLALGNVISALGDERKRGQHVPYRQSKLTRILQDSLGGNSRTCMIACISTADINHEETLNTLKYANRARNIHNKPIINRDSRAVQMNQLKQELKILQEELISMRLRDTGNATDTQEKKPSWSPTSQWRLCYEENNGSGYQVLGKSSCRHYALPNDEHWYTVLPSLASASLQWNVISRVLQTPLFVSTIDSSTKGKEWMQKHGKVRFRGCTEYRGRAKLWKRSTDEAGERRKDRNVVSETCRDKQSIRIICKYFSDLVSCFHHSL